MKKSQFIVEQEGFHPDSMLLYSTFSTSIIEIKKSLYTDIFKLELYSIHTKEVNALIEMGFLIPDNKDELKFLEKLRIKTIESNKTAPTYYIICPTTECNARCYYCFERGAMQSRMDSSTAEAVAQYIVNNHDQQDLVIQWFGGEPLLEPKTISFIAEHLKSHSVKFASKIITNGYLLTDEIISLAQECWNVKIIQITIDALKGEYNRIKNYKYPIGNPFQIVMENIGRCLKKKINVRIRVNFNPLEYEKALETVNYLKYEFGADPYFFLYLAPIDSVDMPAITGEFSEQKKHPLISLIDAEKDFCSFGNYDKRTDSSNDYDAVLKKYYLTPIPASCYGGCESSLTIDSMGNIFDCHRLLGHVEYSSGNVFTGRVKNDVSDYYTNPFINDISCNTCKLLPLCQGGCKYRANKYGKEHACTLVKGAINELIKRAAREINE